ncbi:hypothetical protein CK203_039831 [Vitis vinifera]|uniref:Uncharacterized protein n=1 Tax=Vitis vinifera TaxID=29760 RepID=A0A438HQF8_VITVI|nr:hypothetical protein CK203_039831 [Vitis vinifera]
MLSMLYVLGPLPNQSMSAFPFVLTAWAAANADLCLSSLSFLALLPMPIIDLFFIIKFSHTWPLDSLTMVGSIRPTHDIIDIAAMTLVLLGFSTSCMHDSCAPVHPVLKREILLLSVGIGTACSGYCLIVLSAQAAISYAAGVLFSRYSQTDGHFVNPINICLFLPFANRGCRDCVQLLVPPAFVSTCGHLSKEAVPQIFMKKKSKKIGIRSQDLEDLLEKTIKGSGIALSSPRLVIPAALYGLWILSQHFAGDFFDFQLVPAMFGMFAYKAAALVQVYRDNEDLQFVFPDNEEGSID